MEFFKHFSYNKKPIHIHESMNSEEFFIRKKTLQINVLTKVNWQPKVEY